MSNGLSPEKKTLLRVLTWTVSILGVLTSINVLFIISSVGPGIKVPFVRKVASVPKTQPIIKEFLSPIIEFDCKKLTQDLNITTKSPTTRVSFKHCKKVGRVVNQSNKNQGDIFLLPGKIWTSDFIFLSPGLNTLKIPMGKKVYTIEITREMIKNQATKKAL